MLHLIILMDHHALWVVALNTLLHESGVPVPLTPTVLVAGASSVSGGAPALALIAAVIVGTLLGNSVWFAAGRRYGSTTLKFLCRVALSPDSCMTRTEASFGRWGWSSIVVGRFIPGVSLLTPPLAGALGMSWSKFIALSTAGSALWGLTIVSAGMLLHKQLDGAIRVLDAFGGEALAAIILLLAVYIGWRWLKQRRTAQNLDVRRITVSELKTLIDHGDAPLVVDVRSPRTRCIDPRRVPTAVAADLETIREGHIELPRDREIVLYCACPSEASAVHVARLLLARGYERVRALLGGLEAWVVAGHAVDVDEEATHAGGPAQPPSPGHVSRPKHRSDTFGALAYQAEAAELLWRTSTRLPGNSSTLCINARMCVSSRNGKNQQESW